MRGVMQYGSFMSSPPQLHHHHQDDELDMLLVAENTETNEVKLLEASEGWYSKSWYIEMSRLSVTVSTACR